MDHCSRASSEHWPDWPAPSSSGSPPLPWGTVQKNLAKFNFWTWHLLIEVSPQFEVENTLVL